MIVLRYIRHCWRKLLRQAKILQKRASILFLEPFLQPSYVFFGAGELLLDRAYPEDTERTDFDDYPMLGTKLEQIIPSFIAGFFTVGDTGKVEIEFLFEGWNPRGEMAIFSLAGMDELILDPDAFIRQAALRSRSNSHSGYILTHDRLKTSLTQKFVLQPGDRFGMMFVCEGEVTDILTKPPLNNIQPPLFSLATDKSDNTFLFGQIVDLTGQGNTFMMEDFRLDGQFEGNLIFKLRGAIGQAPTLDRLNP